jgi:signal transduction histidine kinase
MLFSLITAIAPHNLAASNTNASQSAKQLNIKAYNKLMAGAYNKSYQLSIQAKAQAEKEKNNKETARALSNLASNLSYLGKNESALALYNQSLAIAKSIDDYTEIDRAINNIADIYSQLSNLTESHKYRLQLYEFSQKKGSKYDQLTAAIGLASSYSNLGELVEARYYQDQSKDLLQEVPNSFLEVYVWLGEYEISAQLNDKIQARKALSNALQISTKNKYDGLIATTRTKIAENYFKYNQLEKAEQESLAIIDLVQKLQLKNKELQNHLLLSRIYESTRDFEKSLNHTKQATKLNELISGERVRQLAEITKIERNIAATEEKLKYSLQQQKIAKLRLETQTQAQIILSAIVISLIVLLMFWYHRRTAKKELLRHIKLNQELMELDKLKDQILTNTSHELRTPLNGIIGLSDIIIAEYEGQLDIELQQSIELIGKSGRQLSDIVNDILDLAQLKAKKMAFQSQNFDLIKIIKDVISLCRPLLLKNETEIVFLPKQDTLEVTQDKKRLQQVLFNIIGNAIKFTPAGCVNISVSVDNNFLFLKVKDTGLGIPENKIERIFEGFEQVNASNNRTVSGSGLGLAISKELALALGGDITIKSELGKGTLVSFYFPIKKGTNSALDNSTISS